MKILIKHKAYPEGTVRKWKDGTTRKKVGKLWVVVHTADKFIQKRNKKANQYMNYALTTSLGDVIDGVLQSHKLNDFKAITKYVGNTSYNAASNLFREIKQAIDKTDKPVDAKKLAVTMVGKALVMLHREYWGNTKPRVRLKVQSKTGKIYYKNKLIEVPVISANRLKTAKDKLGGWGDMKKLPSFKQIKAMLRNKTAAIVRGKPDSHKKWEVGQLLRHTIIPWKPTETGIQVLLRQTTINKKRKSINAEVKINIPYEYAPAFLSHHITGKKTRNNLLGQLNRSKGYRNFLRSVK